MKYKNEEFDVVKILEYSDPSDLEDRIEEYIVNYNIVNCQYSVCMSCAGDWYNYSALLCLKKK